MEPDEGRTHIVDRESVTKTVREVLRSADLYGLKEVAFPLIGTGLMGLSVQYFFEGFRQGLQEYTEHSKNKSLKRIQIVIYSDSTKLPEGIASSFQINYPTVPQIEG